MNVSNVISLFNRFSIQKSIIATRNLHLNHVPNFWITPCLMAEPLKKKKRLDPAVIKAREDRRRKKLEKQIRRLEKNSRELKPIDECEVPLSILDERSKRERTVNLSPEILERRNLLEKKWAQYKRNQVLADAKMIDRLIFCQQKALDELRKESEELYQEAIQFDFQLIPFKREGPVETPPIENYDVPDGDYLDISKKWEK